jgi:hypothetical protein
MPRSPWMTWNPAISSPSPVGGARLARVVGLLLALALFAGAPVSADAAWQVLEQEASARFSSSLDATLRVRSETAIEHVILFYGRAGDRIVRRIYPPFRPGFEVSLEHSESLERGQFAPGTELRIWWRLVDASGDTFDTPVQIIEYTDDAQDWQVLTGDTVDVHYYDTRQSRAVGWLTAAETALGEIESEIGLTPEGDVSIYVYRNEVDMSAAVASRSDDYDARVTTLGVAVDDDTLILLGSQRNLEATLAHELSHVVVGMATDNPYAGLPRWLDEGLAMVAEGDLPQGNALALQLGIANDNLLSVRSMTSYSGQADKVDLYYGECYSVVTYLIDEFGRERMTALLSVFAEGSLQNVALTQVYGFDVEKLDALWRESLGLGPRSLAPGGPDYAGASPLRILG